MNKGFTLVELLGTIVILSLIVIIGFPSLLNQIKDSNKTVDESVVKVVEAAARDYVLDHIEDYPKGPMGETTEYEDASPICVNFLVEQGYIQESFRDKYIEISNAGVEVSAQTITEDDGNQVQSYVFEYQESGCKASE